MIAFALASVLFAFNAAGVTYLQKVYEVPTAAAAMMFSAFLFGCTGSGLVPAVIAFSGFDEAGFLTTGIFAALMLPAPQHSQAVEYR